MAEARRTVCRWLLAALLERGPQLAVAVPEATRIERPLSPHEARRLLGPSRHLLSGRAFPHGI
jgi:hypothetical protein